MYSATMTSCNCSYPAKKIFFDGKSCGYVRCRKFTLCRVPDIPTVTARKRYVTYINEEMRPDMASFILDSLTFIREKKHWAGILKEIDMKRLILKYRKTGGYIKWAHRWLRIAYINETRPEDICMGLVYCTCHPIIVRILGYIHAERCRFTTIPMIGIYLNELNLDDVEMNDIFHRIENIIEWNHAEYSNKEFLDIAMIYKNITIDCCGVESMIMFDELVVPVLEARGMKNIRFDGIRSIEPYTTE